MKYIRIIPRLDIKGPNLVKGIHLEGLRVMGKPEDFAASIYHALGISLHTDLPGPGARPVPIVEIGVEPVQELFA